MIQTSKMRCLAIVLLVVVCCALLPAVQANGQFATVVRINGVRLDSTNAYWRNGNLPADPSNWNAYYNAATGLLQLKNAYVDTIAVPDIDLWCCALVGGNYNYRIELIGHSVLRGEATNVRVGGIQGFFAEGNLEIFGEGSAEITLQYTADESSSEGILTRGNLLLRGGSLTIDVTDSMSAYGFYAEGDITVAGGKASMRMHAPMAIGVYTEDGTFAMSNGVLDVLAQASGYEGWGIYADQLRLSGGIGTFRATQILGDATGLRFGTTPAAITGGYFIFAGTGQGVFFGERRRGVLPQAEISTREPVFVSKLYSGAALLPWRSALLDGVLISSSSSTSPYRYVQIGTQPMPKTGDTAIPWVWVGCILLCGLAAGAFVLWRRKRKG